MTSKILLLLQMSAQNILSRYSNLSLVLIIVLQFFYLLYFNLGCIDPINCFFIHILFPDNLWPHPDTGSLYHKLQNNCPFLFFTLRFYYTNWFINLLKSFLSEISKTKLYLSFNSRFTPDTRFWVAYFVKRSKYNSGICCIWRKWLSKTSFPIPL